MITKIPVLDLSPEIEELWDELNESFRRVLRSGQFILGPEVKAFESEVAAYLGVKHAIGVNSGTDALVIALRALGIGPGDEVITTPFTFIATAEAASHTGASPVFVDIDPVTYNLDVELIEPALTPRTRAIIPVHLYGHSAEMDAIREIARRHDLKVVEDVAQAFGAEYRGRKLGTLGDLGAFSFFPSKTLGAFGDGGLVVTDRDDLAGTVRMLRAHGARKKYYNEVFGYNSRLDELQAAMLRVKLRHIDEWISGRRMAAERYLRLFSGHPAVEPPRESPGCKHVYHQYTVRISGNTRDWVLRELAEAAIGAMVYYPTPLHQLPVYRGMGDRLPEAERAAAEVISLPIWPTIPEEAQRRVAGIVAQQPKALVAR
jgi:dTDP-4-amino-4,6-dideoxygalactose transaminase